MDIDEVLVKIVAIALTRGQGAFTEEDLFAACQQVHKDRIAGTFVELLFEGQLALVVDDKEEVRYIGLDLADKSNSAGDEFSDEEVASVVEAFISSVQSQKDQEE